MPFEAETLGWNRAMVAAAELVYRSKSTGDGSVMHSTVNICLDTVARDILALRQNPSPSKPVRGD